MGNGRQHSYNPRYSWFTELKFGRTVSYPFYWGLDYSGDISTAWLHRCALIQIKLRHHSIGTCLPPFPQTGLLLNSRIVLAMKEKVISYLRDN